MHSKLGNGRNTVSRVVYFLSSLRAQTAKTLICTNSGVPADSKKSAQKVRRTALFVHFLRKKVRFSELFPHFLALFLGSAGTPLFVQINVFAVWALRLDRKYTIREYCFGKENSLSLTEFWGKLGEFCETLGEFALAHKK